MSQMEDLHKPHCIRTYSGKYLDYTNPKPEMIDIRDIAVALSRIPRFAGHTRQFLSVAEHSINCYEKVYQVSHAEDTKRMDRTALLHDASEAYCMDIPYPLKQLLPDYHAIESRVMYAIAEKFDLIYPLPAIVKQADAACLHQEWEQLVLNDQYHPMPPGFAERMFLNRYHGLQQ